MSLILDFNEKEKEIFKNNIEKHQSLKPGGEGTCYVINDDTYKIYREERDIENPICKDDLNLESFLFPEEIYRCNNKIFSYKTKFIQNNEFKIPSFRNWKIPNINKIKKALIPLIKDIYILSKNNIYAIDLAWRNTLFDGEKLYIIDTLDYEIVDEDQLEDNIKSLKNIITCLIANVNLAHEAYHVEISENDLKEYQNLHIYTKEILKQVQEEYKDKEVQKIKRSK